jgi:hypothetical protein
MRPQTTLLLIEQVPPIPIVPSATAQSQTLADLNMLVRTGGQERTEEEYRTLLDASGFELIGVIPTHGSQRGSERAVSSTDAARAMDSVTLQSAESHPQHDRCNDTYPRTPLGACRPTGANRHRQQSGNCLYCA